MMGASVRATRQLLDAITGFRTAYTADDRFREAIKDLDKIEEQIEKLVPAAADRVDDAADEPPPRTLPDANTRARDVFRRDRGTRMRQERDQPVHGETEFKNP